MNGNDAPQFGRPHIFPSARDEGFFLQGFGRDAAASRAAPAASRESESELLLLIEARNWELARVRAEAFAAEARPTSAAYRGISQTALSSAVRMHAPLETVAAILRANPDALVKVRHARRGTVLHEAIRYKADVDVVAFLVDEAVRIEGAAPPGDIKPAAEKKRKSLGVHIWGQVDDVNRTILHHMVGRICASVVQVTPRSTTSSATNFRAPPRFRGGENGRGPPTPQEIDKMVEICGKIARAYPGSLTMVNMDGQTPLMTALVSPPMGNFAPKDATCSLVDKTIEKLVSMFCECRPDACEQSITPDQIMGIMSGASLQRVARGGIRHVNRQHEVLAREDHNLKFKDDEEKRDLSVNVGPNALHAAITHHRSVATIEKLLTANPSSNRSAYAIVTQQLETPLHVAVTVRAPVAVIRLLLEHGPEAVIAGDRHSLTPLDWVWIRHVLDRAHLVGKSNSRDDGDSDAESVAATLPHFEPNRPYARRTIPSPFLQNWKDAAKEIELLSEAMNDNNKGTKRMRVGSFTNYRATTGALWERMSFMLPVAAREMYRLLEQSQDEMSEEWPVYHAASYVPCPVPLLDLAFFYYPDQVQQKDARGFLPIHYTASCPYHDTSFDLPESMTSGVSPYIRAQHQTTFCDLSPIPKVIKHYPEAASIVTPDGRLPLHIALEMIKDHQSTFRVACQSQVLTPLSSQNDAVPWEVSRFIIRSFIEVNTAAFEQQDPQTRLYPFQMAVSFGECFVPVWMMYACNDRSHQMNSPSQSYRAQINHLSTGSRR